MEFQRSFGWIEAVLLITFIVGIVLFVLRIKRLQEQAGSKPLKVVAKIVLRSIYFLLMLVALLGPSFGDQTKKVKSEGKDIYIAIDLSKSMDAQDIRPSRMEKLKFELSKIVTAFNSDRIGLIIFTSEAFLQSPLTYDHNMLLNLSVGTLSTEQVGNKGTDFAPPLKMALEKHLNEKEKGQRSKKTSKIIILISDGEDFGDESEDIANQIKEEGIRLFTLGIGTKQGGKIPNGYAYMRNRFGDDVVTKLDASGLKNLADITDGEYFEISDGRNDVPKLINAIAKIKGEFRDARSLNTKANKYFYFLLVAFILMLSDVLITVKTVKI